ncbi:hypothetical protein ACHAXS_005051 [Conticribra weissflogii]
MPGRRSFWSGCRGVSLPIIVIVLVAIGVDYLAPLLLEIDPVDEDRCKTTFDSFFLFLTREVRSEVDRSSDDGKDEDSDSIGLVLERISTSPFPSSCPSQLESLF